MAEVLDAALGGATKKKIMYKAFLSHTQLVEYLSVLVRSGLLEFGANKTYKTAPKGQRYLELYFSIREYIPVSIESAELKRRSPVEILHAA